VRVWGRGICEFSATRFKMRSSWEVEYFGNECRVMSDEWLVASGKWRVASGEWQVASGEWRVTGGE